MGLFDKKSNSSSSTSASQSTTSAADGSNAFSFGNISTGRNSKIDLGVNITSTDYGAISSALSFADDAFSNAAALTADNTRSALSFANDAFSDGTALTGRVLDKQTTANLEFLGEISNFAELSAQTAKDNAAFSERQAASAISAVQKAQSDALSMTNRLAQDTQTATLKALDYVFESSKSETARLADNSLKWIVGGAVAVFVLPFLMKAR